MGIFEKIWSKITNQAKVATPAGAGAGNRAAPSPATPPPMPGAAAPAPAASAPVDVEAIMEELERKSGHKSNWRVSIVDLMSLLGMENSLAERKELAKELGYTGDMSDSASMNIWLHKQVMQKLAANGGKVPQDLL